MKKIFALSFEIPDKSGNKKIIEPGRAHYSYRAVKDKFSDLFDEQDEQWIDLKNPEVYRDFNIHQTLFGAFDKNFKKVHISFKSPQYLRVAGGFFNVAHVAWEFEAIKSKYSSTPVLPANDDLRMLKAFDQIWVGCEFTKNVFEKNNLKNVHVIPAPIKTPLARQISRDPEKRAFRLEKLKRHDISCWPVSVRNHGFMYAGEAIKKTPFELSSLLKKADLKKGKIFLQILNPHDYRKNLKRLVKAFHALRFKYKDSILILKFTSPEKDEKVYEILRWFLDDSHALDAEGVYFTTDYIPEVYKYEFMSLFDFYVSPSRAEGQNLPLQEAMACGLIPVTTCNTAMLDYISEENSFIINGSKKEITHLHIPDKSMWGFEWFDSNELDVFFALEKAVKATDQEVEIKRKNAKSIIDKKYSTSVVLDLINAALDESK